MSAASECYAEPNDNYTQQAPQKTGHRLHFNVSAIMYTMYTLQSTSRNWADSTHSCQ